MSLNAPSTLSIFNSGWIDPNDLNALSNADKARAVSSAHGRTSDQGNRSDSRLPLPGNEDLAPLALLYAIYSLITETNIKLQKSWFRNVDRAQIAREQLDQERLELYEQEVQKFLEAQEKARIAKICNIVLDEIVGMGEIGIGLVKLSGGVSTGNPLEIASGSALLAAGLIGVTGGAIEAAAFMAGDHKEQAESLNNVAHWFGYAQTTCELTGFAIDGMGAVYKGLQNWRRIGSATKGAIEDSVGRVTNTTLEVQNHVRAIFNGTPDVGSSARAAAELKDKLSLGRMINACENNMIDELHSAFSASGSGVMEFKSMEGDLELYRSFFERISKSSLKSSNPFEHEAATIADELIGRQGWKNINKEFIEKCLETISKDFPAEKLDLENILEWGPKLWDKLAESEISAFIKESLQTQGWQTVAEAEVESIVKKITAEISLSKDAERWSTEVLRSLAEKEISTSIWNALQAQHWREITKEQVETIVKKVLNEVWPNADQLIAQLKRRLLLSWPVSILKSTSYSVEHLYIIVNLANQTLQVARQIVNSIIGFSVANSEAEAKKLHAQGEFLRTSAGIQQSGTEWYLKQARDNAMNIGKIQTDQMQISRELYRGHLNVVNALVAGAA